MIDLCNIYIYIHTLQKEADFCSLRESYKGGR